MIAAIQAKAERESNGAPVTIVLQIGGVAGIATAALPAGKQPVTADGTTIRAKQPVQNGVYWLAEARAAGQKPGKVMDAALGLAGVRNGPAAALLRNLDIAEKLGCLDESCLAAPHRRQARVSHYSALAFESPSFSTITRISPPPLVVVFTTVQPFARS